MKDWLWLSAVVLLGLFVLGLCWVFFWKYCPCRESGYPEPDLPTHVERQISHVSQRDWGRPTSPWASSPSYSPWASSSSSSSSYAPWASSSSYAPCAPSPSYAPKIPPPTVPRRAQIPPSSPHSYALSPNNSPNLHLKFVDIPISDVLKTDHGITTLDLHHMTVREATQTTNKFLRQSVGQHKVRIVTGRGLHSEGGTPKLKPAIALLLKRRGFEFREVNNGGCFEVTLS
ncbi:uncharacterized protein [Procambarus clarkii]|uniref:uncharacterized protein isoform X1 n=1 Tax=Procambarus clarkii TaxID=6728 RepID=UPI0037424523